MFSEVRVTQGRCLSVNLTWENWLGEGMVSHCKSANPPSYNHQTKNVSLSCLTLACFCSVTCTCHALYSYVSLCILMAQGLSDPTYSGVQLGTQAKLARCQTGLDLKTKWKLWIVVLILALWKTRVDFFHSLPQAILSPKALQEFTCTSNREHSADSSRLD